MTVEEMHVMATEEGLDPEHLVIFEPWFDKNLQARRFRMEYHAQERLLDWNFMLTPEELEDKRFAERMINGMAQAGIVRFAWKSRNE